ncbi:MAG: transcriptional regulator [Pseudomonadota bacterium]|jgi:GntR family transcriptional regulator, carbon starvation induced regulator
MRIVSNHSSDELKQEPKTLVEGAYLALRNDIIKGVYTPSSKLKVEHLKDIYQVSGGTLREALALLVADSLVYAEGQKGFFVSAMSLKDFKEITELRVMLEMQALKQSIENGNDKWEADVMAAYHRLALAEKKLALGDIEERNAQFSLWEERNAAFHAALVSACESKWILQFIGILYQQSERYRSLGVQYGTNLKRDLHAEHEALKDAALARNIPLCSDILAQHIGITYELFENLPESVFSGKEALELA